MFDFENYSRPAINVNLVSARRTRRAFFFISYLFDFFNFNFTFVSFDAFFGKPNLQFSKIICRSYDLLRAQSILFDAENLAFLFLVDLNLFENVRFPNCVSFLRAKSRGF